MKRLICAIVALTLAGAATAGAPPRAGHAMSRAGAPEVTRTATAILLPRSSTSKATGSMVIEPEVMQVRLLLSVAHLQPKTAYSALIYSGSCGSTATVQQILPDLTTDAHGNALLMTTFRIKSIPPSGWVISVPLKQKSEMKTPGPGVICGNINRVGVDVPLADPVVGYSYTATGDVLVTRHISKQGMVDMSKTLGAEVDVYLEKAAPRHTYTVTIFRGRCGGPGPALYHLSSIETNAKGYAVGANYFAGAFPYVNMAVKVEDTHGRVATCGEFPGYGLTQPAGHA